MTGLRAITEALADWPSPRQAGEEVAVPTHCIYPSNGVVRVFVAGGEEAFVSSHSATFKVHDGAGALDEFEASGGVVQDQVSVIRGVAKAQGLQVTEHGVIVSPLIRVEQLATTIVLVANASKESAHALTDRYRRSPKKNFREALARVIHVERSRGAFLQVAEKPSVIGASSKLHRFDYELLLNGQRRLLLDAVLREPSSINSVLAANLDVRESRPEHTMQRIVYDDLDGWSSADLSLLGLGATVVPFSKLRTVLEGIAA